MTETSNPAQQGRDDVAEGLPNDAPHRIFDTQLTAKGGDNVAPTAAEIAEYEFGYSNG